jgi:hypothetical protein
MLEDSLDPRPHPAEFAGLIEERAAERGQPSADVAGWLLSWHDREGAWTNLRNVEHWIEYATR